MRLSTILKPKFKEETYNSKNSAKKMHFWKAIKTEEINNTSHFMTPRDNWKIFWESKKTNAWMLNSKSKGFRWSMKSIKRIKQLKSTELSDNLTSKTRPLKEKHKQSEDFNKKSEWKTIRLNHLLTKFKASELKSSDQFHPSLNHPQIRTKIFWKNWLSKWEEINPSQRTITKYSWKLLSISWEQKRTKDWKAKFLLLEISLIWWGETQPSQMFSQSVQLLKMSLRAESVNLRE